MGKHYGNQRIHYKEKKGKLNAEQRSKVARIRAIENPRGPSKPRKPRPRRHR